MAKQSKTANPDICDTLASELFPTTVDEVFEWAAMLTMQYGLYTRALINGVSYFITQISLEGKELTKEDKRAYLEVLYNDYGIKQKLLEKGVALLSFGNIFTGYTPALSRDIVCLSCKAIYPITEFEDGELSICSQAPKESELRRFREFSDSIIKDEDSNYQESPQDVFFKGTCKRCKSQKTLLYVLDQVDTAGSVRVKLLDWSPDNISLSYCPDSEEYDYAYEPSEDAKIQVNNGEMVALRSLDTLTLNAIARNTKVSLNSSAFMHTKIDSPSYIKLRSKGWGLPPFLSSFTHVINMLILDRYNGALVSDYLMPFRTISPKTNNSGMDPIAASMGHGNLVELIKNALVEHKEDPSKWHFLPCPVEYNAYGGEAAALIPYQSQEQALMQLLTSMGIPLEFTQTNLKTGSNPIGLRIFERSWMNYMSPLEVWLNWFVDGIRKVHDWKNFRAFLDRDSSTINDVRSGTLLQLAMEGRISEETGFKPLGLDPSREYSKVLEERKDRMKSEMDFQKEMAQAGMHSEYMSAPPGTLPPPAVVASGQMGVPPMGAGPMGSGQGPGAMPAAPGMLPTAGQGGAPPAEAGMPPEAAAGYQEPASMGMPGAQPLAGGELPPMPNLIQEVPQYTLEQLHVLADQISQTLLVTDMSSRMSYLSEMASKEELKTLHALVKENLKSLEQQAGSMGVQAARQGAM